MLERDKKQRPNIRYVTESELRLILEDVKDSFEKLLYQCLLYSGCRIGELFALDSDDYEDGLLNIDKQMLRKFEVKKRKLKSWKAPTKTDETRIAVLTEEFDELFKSWTDIPIETRLKLRDERWAERLSAACIKAFPGKPTFMTSDIALHTS